MSISEQKRADLANAAIKARELSYSPYSSFAVGAALLTKSGKIYLGANIENASYTPTVCAERVAIFSAVHAGERDFEAIAISGGKEGEDPTDPVAPCGVCRQVMTEFADGDLKVILAMSWGYREYTLDSLMPLRFDRDSLGK
jgi:cytidine deaminase